MSPRPDASAERIPQILLAAEKVFLQKGFVAARVEDIARAANLSVGNLYRYFPGKLDITLALMELSLEPSAQILENLIHAPGNARQRLEQAFLEELLNQDEAQQRMYAELYHLARSEPRVHDLLAGYNSRYQASIAAVLEQGISRGELRRCDPNRAAFTFQCLFDGFMQNLAFTPADSLADTLRQNFEILFNGLSAS